MFDSRFLLTQGNEGAEQPSPFSLFTPEAKFSFSTLTEAVYKGFDRINKTTQNVALSFTPYTNEGRLISEFTESTTFLDTSSINIMVPPGFKGSLLNYSKLLSNMFTVMSHLDEEVLEPTQNALAETVGSNKQMGIITMDKYSRDLLLHTDQIATFKNDLATFFDTDTTNETLKFPAAFDRFKDLEGFTEIIRELQKTIKKAPTADIAKRVEAISKSANLLNLRLKQGKLEHLRNTQAEFISSLLIKASTEVEFYAALVTMINQLFTVHSNMLEHLKRVTS